MKVVVHRRAARYLRRLPADQKARIKNRLVELASDPTTKPGVRQMKGRWAGYCRLRIGDRRVIFFVDDQKQIVYVDHIGARGDVYSRGH